VRTFSPVQVGLLLRQRKAVYSGTMAYRGHGVRLLASRSLLAPSLLLQTCLSRAAAQPETSARAYLTRARRAQVYDDASNQPAAKPLAGARARAPLGEIGNFVLGRGAAAGKAADCGCASG